MVVRAFLDLEPCGSGTVFTWGEGLLSVPHVARDDVGNGFAQQRNVAALFLKSFILSASLFQCSEVLSSGFDLLSSSIRLFSLRQ